MPTKNRILANLKQLGRVQKTGLCIALLFLLYTITGFLILPSIVKSTLVTKISEKLHRKVTIKKVLINPFALTLEIEGLDIRAKDSSSETFASFNKLYTNLDISSVFHGFPILEEVSLDDPYLKIVRMDKNRFNFSDLLPDKEVNTEEKKKNESQPPKFSIHDIRVRNGKVEIVDAVLGKEHSIANVDITVPVIENLGNKGGTRVEPNLTAKVNGSPFDINGYLEFLADPESGKANIAIRNFDVSHYAAYLPKELNFNLVSGQLDMKTEVDFGPSKEGQTSLKLSGNASLRNLRLLSSQGNELLGIDRVDVDVDEYDLLANRLHISKVNVNSPNLNVIRDRNGKINIAMLYAPDKKNEKELAKPKTDNSFSLVLEEFALSGGKIDFADSAVPGSFKTTFAPIDLSIKNFTNGPGSKAEIRLSATTETGESITGNSMLSLNPLVASGSMKFSRISIPKYSPYFKAQLQFDIQNANLDFAADYQYAEGGHGPWIKLSKITSSLSSLKFRMKDGEDFMDVGIIALNGGEFDLVKKRLNLNQISSQNGAISVTRYKDGMLNLQKLLPESDFQANQPAETKATGSSKPWHVALKSARFSDYLVKANDLKAAKPTTITADKLQLSLDNFSMVTGNESDVAISFQLNNSGKVSAAGKVKIDPLYASLKLNLQDVAITPFEPYYRDYVKVYITGGNLSAAGNAVLDSADPSEAKVTYSGDFSITDFTSLPRVEGKEIVKWKSFALKGIDTGNAPLHLNIDNIDLVELTSYVRVNPDGTINFRQVLKEKAEMPTPTTGERQAEPGDEKTARPRTQSSQHPKDTVKEVEGKPSNTQRQTIPISVKQIALQDCIIDYTDDLIQPNFHASFYDATGTVTGLSSQPGTSADVQIKAKLEEYAPAEISGRINPLAEDLFVDMTLSGSNLDLTLANPYSRKFTGYPIEKGKLNFKFFYQIDHGKLNAYHHLKFDRLKLGDKVDSPDAPDLPLKFALSILQNRDGDMVLDIPVSGEIDNPKFDFTQIIKAAISNVLKKVITAPFALLGSIFGAGKGEDLSYVAFQPGSSEITSEGAKKLEVVAKALYQRPTLELDVAGYVDKQKDTKALKEQKLKEKAEMQESDASGKKQIPQPGFKTGGKKTPTPEQSAVKADNSTETKGGKIASKNLKDQTNKEPPSTQVKVSTEELRELARKRAASVMDFLSKSGKVDPKRIFVVLPKSLEPKDKTVKTANSATLSLK